jgi:hypothetical protein
MFVSRRVYIYDVSLSPDKESRKVQSSCKYLGGGKIERNSFEI